MLVGGPQPGHVTMQASGNGWHEATVEAADESTHYAFHVDGKPLVPDPASRCNPDDVHGASRLVDPRAYEWQTAGWRGRPWHEAVIYEMHVGTFTAAGTFAAAIERLDDLAALGVTALELMPVASFSGSRNWGYDGVLLFAPQPSYGTPEDFKRLIDAAHERGLMVLLDVVYNHFGPDGNYLHVYAPQFFNPKHQTPWGAAINFDGDDNRTVRDFFIHNALYWLEEYQLDGLRLDAIHAIADDSTPHIVEELARAVRDGPGRDRHVHLVLENDHNQARYLPREPDGRAPLATAQWNDDIHHAIHVLATGETDGYYADYAQRPLAPARSLARRGLRLPGRPVALSGRRAARRILDAPAAAGLRRFPADARPGRQPRLRRAAGSTGAGGRAARADRLRAAGAGAADAVHGRGIRRQQSLPVSSATSAGELAQAVTHGRRNEFGRFARFSDPAVRDRIPDPNDAATFARSTFELGRDRAAAAPALARALPRAARDPPRTPRAPAAADTQRQLRSGGLGFVAGALASGRRRFTAPAGPSRRRGRRRARGHAGRDAVCQPRHGRRTAAVVRALVTGAALTTRLEHLARLKGIALDYTDVWQQAHQVEPQVLVDLLGAMHVAAQDEPAIEASIAAHEAAAWQRVLPAVWVPGQARAAIPLRLPARLQAASLVWRLTEEGGHCREQTIRVAELAPVERGSVGEAKFIACELPLPAPLADGYHRLNVTDGDAVLGECLLIVAPPVCYVPPALADDGRVWGASAQLYAVRSERNWGIGDFSDLTALVELWGLNGASVVGVNPLHAMFPHNPAHASPYSPSSRLFLNTLYLDVEAIEDYGESEAARSLVRSAPFQARLKRLRGTEMVDYVGVAEAKKQVLEMLFAHFRSRHLAANSARAQAFNAFRATRGEALRRHALFEALQEHFFREDNAIWGWPLWPAEYRQPGAPAVQRFAQEHARARRVLRIPAVARRPAARRRSAAARSNWVSASGSTRTLPCRSTAPAPRPGPNRISTRSAPPSARRPTSST